MDKKTNITFHIALKTTNHKWFQPDKNSSHAPDMDYRNRKYIVE